MKISLHPPGTRIRVRKGALPIDPSLTGRTGLVLAVDDYHPGKYVVTLDGESAARSFTEDELEWAGTDR